MSKIFYYNGKCYSKRKERISVVGVLLFTDWLWSEIGSEDWKGIPKYERDKLFRKYQCTCAKLNTDYESPYIYGVRGLFG